jgi:hypothetical protein
LFAFHVLYSLIAKNIAGIELIAVAIVNIRNVGLQSALVYTTPIKICPNMLPKPAIPSIIPETVARAFKLFLSISYFPRSHSIAAIIIEEPLSEAPNKNITIDIRAILLPLFASPQIVRAKVDILDKIIPRIKTGDRIERISVERPIKIFPQIAPTPKRLNIFAEASFE